MNYILGKQRSQLQIESLDDFVDNNSEVKTQRSLVQLCRLTSHFRF
jgi:hypothetical protein